MNQDSKAKKKKKTHNLKNILILFNKRPTSQPIYRVLIKYSFKKDPVKMWANKINQQFIKYEKQIGI